MKQVLARLTAAALIVSLAIPAASAASVSSFRDIPSGSVLAAEVEKAVNQGLMQGYTADTFGYSDTMTRAQFVTVLWRMMGWSEEDSTLTGYITPAMAVEYGAVSDTYWSAISNAARYDVVDRTVPFRPNDPVTRGEMAEMLVRALGLKSAAENSDGRNTPFTDLPAGKGGYISIAYTIGMTRGTTDTTFSPNATATRAQAAAMLVRIHEKLEREPDFIHGFYAISSYNQLELASAMDAVSAGWSRMTWNGETSLLSTTSANGNEFCIPGGYDEVVEQLEDWDTELNLSVYMDASGGVAELLASPEGRCQAVEQIVNELTVDYRAIGRNPYNGVTVDFEGIGKDRRADFVSFLTDLSAELKGLQKSLYVCVMPVPAGNDPEHNAYDYQAIGALADKVILMAHDYDARQLPAGGTAYSTQPTAPLSRIYSDLMDVVERVDPDKVVLAFSARNIAWQIDETGKLVSGTPVSVSNETLRQRLKQSDTKIEWSDRYQQPYAVYTTEDGSRYYVWYDNNRSIELRLNAARLLGVSGVSMWRLGTVPMDSDRNWGALFGEAF